MALSIGSTNRRAARPARQATHGRVAAALGRRTRITPRASTGAGRGPDRDASDSANPLTEEMVAMSVTTDPGAAVVRSLIPARIAGSRQPRTCRGRRRQAHRHAVPQTTTKYPARPVGSWVRPDQRRALRAGVSGRLPRWPVPPETLKAAVGQQAGALAALQHGPHVLARTRRQPCTAVAIRASACSRQCDPARLGNAVSLTRRCLHLRPTADQGAARVTGQGTGQGCDRRNAPARRATLRGSRTSS